MRQSYMVACLKKIKKLVLNFQMNAMISSGRLVCVISVQTIHVIDTIGSGQLVPNFGTNSSLVKQFIGKTAISCILMKVGNIKIKCFLCNENHQFYSNLEQSLKNVWYLTQMGKNDKNRTLSIPVPH